MGLFTPDGPSYDESVRQTGFNRYKQLISLHWTDWAKVNFLTILGALPLAFAVNASIVASSVAALLQALYWAIYILFAPFTLVLVPFLGFWYITFLVQLLLYDRLDRELQIEERFGGSCSSDTE